MSRFPGSLFSVALPSLPRVKVALLLAAFSFSGCECELEDLTVIEDAGFPEPDAGPPPPVFPLKAGDQIVYTGLGGRRDECEAGAGGAGGCQRAINATYTINAVRLDDENRWEVNADALYEGSDDTITAAELAPLYLRNIAPFEDITVATPSVAEGATFQTNSPPTDQLRPNGFPFFQFEPLNAGENSVFQEAGLAFNERILELDPEAEVEIQAADHKIEAYFFDEATTSSVGYATLHKLRVEYHPIGLICGWDERMIRFEDGMARTENSFAGTPIPPAAAQFTGAPFLDRDNVRFRCSCFDQTCRTIDGSNLCLDPTDPDAAPSNAACNVGG